MKFKLSKYILPAVISMVLVGAYTNIDGLFIGKAAGDDGKAKPYWQLLRGELHFFF